MNVSPEDREALAAEFALGTLEGADRMLAERLAAEDADFRAALMRWQARLSPLDDTAEPLTPTTDLWNRIESALPGQAQSLPSPAGRAIAQASLLQRLWQSLDFWRPVGMVGALAGLVLAAALSAIIARGPVSPTYVAVLNTGDGRAAAVVNAYADGTVELIPLAPIDVPGDRIIEVWTLQSREQGPVSIGRLDRARRLKLDLSRLNRPETNHLFELTLEPPGGSPTGRPTGPILMKGLAARGI